MADVNLNTDGNANNNSNTNPSTNPNSSTNPSTDENKTPTIESLMAELASERATNAKQKNALDKALKEKGEVTKALRARQTAEEQEAEARLEAERQKEEADNELHRRLALYEAKDRYRAMGLPDELVESAAEADVENDKDTLAKIFTQHTNQLLKENDAKWMKKTPQTNSGDQYSSMTREQIMAITDQEERRKAIAANLDLFTN